MKFIVGQRVKLAATCSSMSLDMLEQGHPYTIKSIVWNGRHYMVKLDIAAYRTGRRVMSGLREDQFVAFDPPSYASTPAVAPAVTQPAEQGERDPHGKSLKTPGAKADAGKLRPTLVLRDMARALLAVTKIATDGAVKYTEGGWLEVPGALVRYEDADLRHMLKRFAGQVVDADSKELHLAHEAWNALAKLELYLREQEAGKA